MVKMKDDIDKGNYTPNKNLNHSHIGSIGNLSINSIEEKMNKFLDNLH